MGLFGVDLITAKRMTLYEYRLRSLAYNISRQKEVELTAIQAWFNNQVKATKEVGVGKNKKFKPLFKTFNEFYNSEKAFSSIFDNTEEINEIKDKLSIAEINRRINQKGG